jgi:hypothetical protein
MSESEEIEFEVEGWPPKKNEAKSLFAAGHPKAERVTALLEAARAAVQRYGWSLATGEIAFELTIYLGAPASLPPRASVDSRVTPI